MKYKIEDLGKGRVKIYGIDTYEHGEVEVVLRPMTWDDRTYFQKVDPTNKQQLCQSYARLIESWSLQEPVMVTTLLDDDFVHLCAVIDACIRAKFLKPIEFSEFE